MSRVPFCFLFLQGRTIRSIQLSGIVVAIDSATGNSTLTGSGTIVSQSQTTYNGDGRVAFTTDAYGLETRTTYDSLGRTTETRRQAVMKMATSSGWCHGRSLTALDESTSRPTSIWKAAPVRSTARDRFMMNWDGLCKPSVWKASVFRSTR